MCKVTFFVLFHHRYHFSIDIIYPLSFFNVLDNCDNIHCPQNQISEPWIMDFCQKVLVGTKQWFCPESKERSLQNTALAGSWTEIISSTFFGFHLAKSSQPEVLKSHFGMGVLLFCCIFSEHLFLETPLDGCFHVVLFKGWWWGGFLGMVGGWKVLALFPGGFWAYKKPEVRLCCIKLSSSDKVYSSISFLKSLFNFAFQKRQP